MHPKPSYIEAMVMNQSMAMCVAKCYALKFSRAIMNSPCDFRMKVKLYPMTLFPGTTNPA